MIPTRATTYNPLTVWYIWSVFWNAAIIYAMSLYFLPFTLEGGRGGKFSEPPKRRKSGSVSKIFLFGFFFSFFWVFFYTNTFLWLKKNGYEENVSLLIIYFFFFSFLSFFFLNILSKYFSFCVLSWKKSNFLLCFRNDNGFDFEGSCIWMITTLNKIKWKHAKV